MKKAATFPGRDTKGYELLGDIAVSGELPIHHARRLLGGGRYSEKVITKLRADRLISSYHRNGLSGYRLTKLAKTLLVAGNPHRFSYYLTGTSTTNHVRSEYKDRLRLHCLAEVYVTLRRGDVAFFPDEKPNIFYPLNIPAPAESPHITFPAFYCSTEIKDMGIDALGIRGSRAVGILFALDYLYVSYNTGSSLLKFDYKPEMRLKALVRTTICGNRLAHQYAPEKIRGLLFGESMELAYKLLCESLGGKRNYFIFDGGYDHFHFLPNDHHGEVLLKILMRPRLKDMLDQLLAVGLLAGNPDSTIENDAASDDGAPVLFGYSCDLLRISRFNRALLTHDAVGIIVCFDFQVDALRRFCCEKVVFQTIDFAKLEGRFFK